jgi:hypothetical protein
MIHAGAFLGSAIATMEPLDLHCEMPMVIKEWPMVYSKPDIIRTMSLHQTAMNSTAQVPWGLLNGSWYIALVLNYMPCNMGMGPCSVHVSIIFVP